MSYKRKMGIDYGDVRIGIAFTDFLCTISSPYEVYKTKNEEADLKYLSELAKSQEVDEIVFGLPLNMDGTEGERAEITRAFGEKLSKISGINVVYMDERLTSMEAEELLISAGVRREKRKEVIDKISAQIILQSYLNKRRNNLWQKQRKLQKKLKKRTKL